MGGEKRYLFTLERRIKERRHTNDRRRSTAADLHHRLENLRALVASDRRTLGRRTTDR